MKQKLSALIITYNEEKNIEGVLSSLDFADEIIVVDSFSTDRTVTLSKAFPRVTVYQNKFEDFTSQRNLAISYANFDWVLFLDADERLTKEAKEEIVNTINSSKSKVAYFMYRTFYFCNEKIRFSGTQNDKNYRLFQKSRAKYDDKKKVHETLIVNGDTGILKNKILHYSFASYGLYRKKMVHYGVLKGQELSAKGKRYNLLTHIGKTAFKFFKAYFLKLGVLDGKRGIQLCYLQSLSVHETYKSLKKEGG